jgi:regulatory protein
VRRLRRPNPASGAAEADERTVRTAALALLAGRDFGRREIAERLTGKGYPEAVVEPVLDALTAERLLSEDRFVSHFVSRHAARGHGPMRIRMDLRERGVESAAIDAALEETDVDWTDSARAARRRRFGAAPPADFRERAKQARFLQYRGFSSDQIRAALGPGPDPGDDIES